MGTAAGMAISGLKPFASTFALFAAGRAYEPIRNAVCYAKAPVKIVATHAGLSPNSDGGSHETIEDIALMRTIPGMTIVEPTDPAMLKNLIPKIAAEYGMCYIRLFRLNAPRIYKDGSDFDIGRSVMLRDGSDASVIACGLEVQEALKAAEMLADEGVSVRVLDMFTVKPIDREAVIRAARETGAIVTAENHSVIGGLGSAVAEVVCRECPVPVGFVGIDDVFGEVGFTPLLMERFGLTAKHIAAKVMDTLGRK
jgi:transketolase